MAHLSFNTVMAALAINAPAVDEHRYVVFQLFGTTLFSVVRKKVVGDGLSTLAKEEDFTINVMGFSYAWRSNSQDSGSNSSYVGLDLSVAAFILAVFCYYSQPLPLLAALLPGPAALRSLSVTAIPTAISVASFVVRVMKSCVTSAVNLVRFIAKSAKGRSTGIAGFIGVFKSFIAPEIIMGAVVIPVAMLTNVGMWASVGSLIALSMLKSIADGDFVLSFSLIKDFITAQLWGITKVSSAGSDEEVLIIARGDALVNFSYGSDLSVPKLVNFAQKYKGIVQDGAILQSSP